MSDGNEVQVRAIAEQVAKAAVAEYTQKHPEEPKIPPPLKWAGGIIAALFTAGVAAMAMWLVSSVSNMQVTLARVDERQSSLVDQQSTEVGDLKRRVSALEDYHREGGSERQ